MVLEGRASYCERAALTQHMKNKKTLLWPLGILAALVLIVPVWSYATQRINSQAMGNTSASVTDSGTGPGIPIRLRIPKLNIDAPIQSLGLTPEGAMAAPKGSVEVGWYAPGPRPGEVGSAVLAGHEGWKDAQAAVFDALHTLQAGDAISVEDENGALTSFVVRDVQVYSRTGDTWSVFGSTDGKAHLNLITCEGAWDPVEKTYANRLVVFADKLE